MQVELRMLQQKLQITTMLVTHDQREAMTIADTIVVMADGAVQQIGTPTEIYRNPANRFVAGFIGQSNLLDVTVAGRTHVRLGDIPLAVGAVPDSVPDGAAATLSIRPEEIRVRRAAGSEPLVGRILFRRDVGSQIELRLLCAGSEWLAAIPASERDLLGSAETVAISFQPDSCRVLAQ